MAAEAALFLVHGLKGVICVGDAYGATLELLSQQLSQLGIRTYQILGSELSALDRYLELLPE